MLSLISGPTADNIRKFSVLYVCGNLIAIMARLRHAADVARRPSQLPPVGPQTFFRCKFTVCWLPPFATLAWRATSFEFTLFMRSFGLFVRWSQHTVELRCVGFLPSSLSHRMCFFSSCSCLFGHLARLCFLFSTFSHGITTFLVAPRLLDPRSASSQCTINLRCVGFLPSSLSHRMSICFKLALAVTWPLFAVIFQHSRME